MAVREALSAAVKGVMYGSPTGAEQKLADGLLNIAGLVPPVIDETAARIIGVGQNSLGQILGLTGSVIPKRLLPETLAQHNERVRRRYLEQYASRQATARIVIFTSSRGNIPR